jgi:SpoVK/Ycf46/Vps4 family AAA+-type ATPase
MRRNNLIDDNVDSEKLARLRKNYTGVEIEAVCRSANSYVQFKNIDLNNI